MLRTFKVGTLFDIHPTRAYKMKNDELFATSGTTPVLSNSSVNNGVGGYCGLAPTERGGIITFSDTTTGADTMFYQPDPFIGYPHVQGMYPYNPDKWNENTCLYVISAIRKSAGNGWNYSVKFNRNLVKELPVELPVIKSDDPDYTYTVDDIDYAYMQERITELEQERITELEQERITELDAYLSASELDDYELTGEDKKLLSLSPKYASNEADALGINVKNEEITFSIFKIEEIFEEVEAGYKYKKKDFNKKRDVSLIPTEEYSLPLVNAKFGNNGIMYYGRKSDWNTQKMCIDIIQDGAVSVGTVYAQPESVGVLYNAYLIKPVEEVKSAEALLYMAECIEKSIKKQFSYDKKANWESVKECEISLPITKEGNINFHYMEGYIRAVEKLAIADVMKYKNKVIDTTKRIVEAEIGR